MIRNIKPKVVVRAALSAGLVTAVIAVAFATQSGAGRSTHRAASPAVHLVADSAATSYPGVGLSLAAPTLPLPSAAPAAASADSVMSSLRTSKAAESARGLLGAAVNSSSYTVEQRSATETMPESGTAVVAGVPFDAWVVTVTGVAPVSLSGGPLPAGVSCTFVGVMSISSGIWTEFFTTC